MLLGSGVEKLDLGLLLPVHEEAFGLDVLEYFNARTARIVEQQKIERPALDMQPRPVVIEIAKRDLRDLVFPIDDAAGLFNEAFALDSLGDPEQIEIFPGGGQDAFADGLARMADLVDQH